MLTMPTFDKTSYTAIPVLAFCWGRALDAKVYAYIHGLRPSRVEINWTKMDFCLHRVTIDLDADGRIVRMRQEVEVGCGPGFEDGDTLDQHMGNG